MDKVILLAAIYEGSYDRADKSVKLTFGTNEITPEQAGKLRTLLREYCYIAVKKENFSNEEIKILKDVKTVFDDNKKSPSQTQRSVLFLLWKQNSEGYTDFDDYYKKHMSVIINHLKNKLV